MAGSALYQALYINLVSHVISQDHKISQDGWEPLTVSHHSVKFSNHRHFDSGDITILVFHMILQYHLT